MALHENNELRNWRKGQKEFLGEDDLTRLWDMTGDYKHSSEFDKNAALERFRKSLENQQQATPANKPVFSLPLLKIAATILVLVVAVVLFKPVSSIFDSSTTIASQTGVVKSFDLPDGTKVKLNGNSSFTWKTSYDKKQRRVKLSGEGFFDVEHNASKPFIVETDLAEIKVLGTSFGVKSDSRDYNLTVFVNSGRVEVKTKPAGKVFILSQTQLLNWKKGEPYAEIENDLNGNTLAWSRGKLIFRNTPFREVFAALEKEFKVQIKVESPALFDCPYTQTIELDFAKLKEAFDAIQIACPMQILEQSKGNYIITGKCCG
jgi:transmembrane sensor